MKRCCITYVSEETQIRTAMRYLKTPIIMAKTWNTDNTKHWQEHEATGTLIAGGSAKLYSYFGRQFGGLSLN